MAAIFQKIAGANPENCLVIGAREALSYPFDAGNWTCIRVGFAFGIGSVTGANGFRTNETLNFNIPSNGYYFGLKDTGVAFPLDTGSVFAGWATNYATNQGTTTQCADNTAAAGFSKDGSMESRIIGSNGVSSTDLASSAAYNMLMSAVTANMVRSTNYTRLNAFEVSVSGKNQVGQRVNIRCCAAGSDTSDVSVSAIRAFMTNFSSPQALGSMYFTTGFTAAGGPLPITDALYFYNPFFNNVARFHNIVIERVSGLA